MNLQIKTIFNLLKYTYGVVPIVAGLDKFTNILTDWSMYVSTNFANMVPIETETFMMVVGVIEIIAGLLVLSRPKVGGYVVMGWLSAIALVLIFSGHYIDVAVRDIVMAIGAFVLVKLADINTSLVSN
ncbi:hypothetical protein [Aquimarina sp. AU474]|uniref:hypothetical protein n=1 Tax=Aquimarina sp. AU474 TaxID=2108529 RepID=UPI000D69C257|nr:hypothetical protein [Aquimarina sp. AU474]